MSHPQSEPDKNAAASSGGIHIDLEIPRENAALPLSAKRARATIVNHDYETIKTLDDLALSDITLDQFKVAKDWRARLFAPEWIPEVCDELPRLLTEFLRRPESQQLSDTTRRAQSLKYIFENKTPLVKADDLLPGQTTTSFVGPVIYMDTIGYCIWPELDTVSTRSQNPFKIKPEVAHRLNNEIFPYWLDRKPVQEVARYSDYDTGNYISEESDPVQGDSIDPPLKKKAGETPRCQELMERVAFFISDKATCVSHTVPDFERILKYGFDGLITQMQNDIEQGNTHTEQETEFVQGVISVFEGAKVYAQHLSEAAHKAGNQELARICKKVPAQPAETLHEALCTIWITYHLLLQENTNFGFSIGRLDQLLNPYYIRDWEKLSDPQDRKIYTHNAIDLVCHFFLHCSDHVPLSTEGSETLFAGSGSNQALTLGGTRYENGKVISAVNDMTYIILKATELLSIRDPNVHVRYHNEVHHRDPQGNALAVDAVDPYMQRICQVNIQTRATPAVHGDAAVVHAMASYYEAHEGVSHEEALADAHDYSSIGCIEENSSAKHYGNTGSTLMVLPAVLELAMFGGKHRSDGTTESAPNLIHGQANYTSTPLHEMNSMQDFIEAFRFQLDEMAQQIVQCNNYLGRSFRKVRSSPFLSGMFVGPTNIPGQQSASFRDVAAGGAKYNSAGIAVIGLADVIDSFCVIDSLIFNGDVSAKELITVLEQNFETSSNDNIDEGFLERIRNRFQNFFSSNQTSSNIAPLSEGRIKQINQMIRLAPKYGAGIDQTPGGIYDNSMAIRYTHLLTQMLQDVFYQYRTHRGGRYLPGYWSMTNHAGFGMLSKATPNGRKNGKSFASGITPCPGIVKSNGDPVMILDHILSVTSVDADTVRNGYTYNLSLTTRDPNYFEEDTRLFSRYMKTFVDEDGVLAQMCVSSIDDLIAADKAATAAEQPGSNIEARAALEPYKDLMIRVAGYSAYFTTLSPQMRQEIIDRSNFALDTGVEQHLVASIN